MLRRLLPLLRGLPVLVATDKEAAPFRLASMIMSDLFCRIHVMLAMVQIQKTGLSIMRCANGSYKTADKCLMT
jgi:hypothetical protein